MALITSDCAPFAGDGAAPEAVASRPTRDPTRPRIVGGKIVAPRSPTQGGQGGGGYSAPQGGGGGGGGYEQQRQRGVPHSSDSSISLGGGYGVRLFPG